MTRTYNSYEKSTIRMRIKRRLAIVALLMVLSTVFNMFTLTAFAAPATVEDAIDMLAKCGDDWAQSGTWPEWSEMTALIETHTEVDENGNLVSDPYTPENKANRVPEKLRFCAFMMNTFGTAGKYTQWTREFDKYAEIDSETASIKVKDERTLDKGSKVNDKYNSMLNSFNAQVGGAAVSGVADKLFGTDNFDPDNNFMTPAMNVMYYIVNTLFNVASQCVMWFLLLQCGCDILYIGVDFSRGFLVPFDKSLRGEGASGSGGDGRRFYLPIITKVAHECVYGGASTGSGDSVASKNKVWAYICAQFPVIILCAVFLICVAGGWWQIFISAIAGVVIRFFSYILSFFG